MKITLNLIFSIDWHLKNLEKVLEKDKRGILIGWKIFQTYQLLEKSWRSVQSKNYKIK